MATDLIRYDLLVQDAMRGVMRRVLSDVAENGYLPGDHHLTISFRTGAPGVRLSRRIAEQWPQEMTIILQHQYSNLFVDDEGFGVTLSFRSISENLYIPFEAVNGFFDPSVEFGLRFEPGDAEEEEAEEKAEEKASSPRPGPSLVRAEGGAAPAKPSGGKADKAGPAKASDKTGEKGANKSADKPAGDDGEANVVSIDAFRKKT